MNEQEKAKIEEFLQWVREHPEKIPEIKEAIKHT